MRRKRQSSSEIVLISAAILAVVSAGFAVHYWVSRGVCTDSVVCATISVLAVMAVILLARRIVAVSREREHSSSPIFLVMRSGPKRTEEKPRQIKGKMPEELDH